MTHPAYPPANDGDPQGDRCICGGIRHWHAVSPHGCDDCDCTEFQSQAESDAIRQSNADTDAYYRAHNRNEATS